MNKMELIKNIAENVEITQKDVAKVIESMQTIIKDTVATGDKVTLSGFITFEKKDIEEKSGISRLKGEQEWTTPAHSEIKVKISKAFKTL